MSDPAAGQSPGLESKSCLYRTALRFFFGVFIVGGVIAEAIAGHRAYLAYLSRSWPSTEGVVVQSMASTRIVTGGRMPQTIHETVVRYRYIVLGYELIGDRLTLFDYGSTSERARRLAAAYPEGAKVTVYYRPEDPEFSVLEPGFTIGLVFPAALGLLLIAVPLALGRFAK